MSSRRHTQHSNPQRQPHRSRQSRNGPRTPSSSRHQSVQNQAVRELPPIPDFGNTPEAIPPCLENLEQPHGVPQAPMNVTLSDIEDMFRGATQVPSFGVPTQFRGGREGHAYSSGAAPFTARGSHPTSSRHAGTSTGRWDQHASSSAADPHTARSAQYPHLRASVPRRTERLQMGYGTREASSTPRSSQPPSGIVDQPTDPLAGFSFLFEEQSAGEHAQRQPSGSPVARTSENELATSYGWTAPAASSTTGVAQPTASRKRKAPAFGPAERDTRVKRNRNECNKCGATFANQSQAMRHKSTCQVIFKCNECDYSTFDARALERHRNTHATRTCAPCNLIFHSSRDFTEHNRIIHPTSREFPCKQCGKTYPTPGAVRIHVSRDHAFDGAVECRHCFRRFSTVQGMNKHVSSKHPSPTSSTVCNICGKEFFTSLRLQRHKERMHREHS